MQLTKDITIPHSPAFWLTPRSILSSISTFFHHPKCSGSIVLLKCLWKCPAPQSNSSFHSNQPFQLPFALHRAHCILQDLSLPSSFSFTDIGSSTRNVYASAIDWEKCWESAAQFCEGRPSRFLQWSSNTISWKQKLGEAAVVGVGDSCVVWDGEPMSRLSMGLLADWQNLIKIDVFWYFI